MGYLKKIDPGGWIAVQVANFLEKIRLYGDFYQVSDLLSQIDNMDVCKEIIIQLVKENQKVRKMNRRLLDNGKKRN